MAAWVHGVLGISWASLVACAPKCEFEQLDGRGLRLDEFRRRFRSQPPGQPVVLRGLDLGPGLKKGKGGSGWDPAVLSARFGHVSVQTQDAVVYSSNATGGLARSGLGAATTLGAILAAPGATLFLLKPHHSAVAALGRGLTVPEPLKPLQLVGPTLSVGGRNASSPFHKHPENWFAQLRGEKAWIVRPSGTSAGAADLRSAHPCGMVAAPRRGRPEGVLQCVLREGEVLYLPSQWTHGTCNLAELSLGIGFIGPLDHLPALHLAAALGDGARARELAAAAADLAAPDGEGKRPLHWAALRGHARLAAELLRRRADAGAEDAHGAAPAHLAAFEGHAPVLRALLRAAPGAATARTHAGAQPLHLAASRGHAAVASLLLRSGASAAAADLKGAQPLHMAAYEGHLAAAELLLAHGASAHARANDGTEPVHLARKRRHHLLIARLLGSDSSAPLDRADL